jgi:hypothetical protein
MSIGKWINLEFDAPCLSRVEALYQVKYGMLKSIKPLYDITDNNGLLELVADRGLYRGYYKNEKELQPALETLTWHCGEDIWA